MGESLRKEDGSTHVALVPRGEAAQLVEEVERRNRVLTLRKRGLSYPQISEVLAKAEPPMVISQQGVRHIVQSYLDRMAREDGESVAQLRALENERLDELMNVWRSKALEGDPKAAQIVLRINERRSKMNGLDAATQVNHNVSGSVLHELGVDPAEIARSEEAFITAFGREDGGPAAPGEASYEEVTDVVDVPDAELVE